MPDVKGYNLPNHNETYMYADAYAREQIAMMADTIIEQGVSGFWTYRKQESGIAECWCRYNSDITPSNTMNNMYYSNTISVQFPFEFTETPTISIGGGTTSGINWAREFASTKTVASFIVCSAANMSTNNVNINIHAIGKWK